MTRWDFDGVHLMSALALDGGPSDVKGLALFTQRTPFQFNPQQLDRLGDAVGTWSQGHRQTPA